MPGCSVLGFGRISRRAPRRPSFSSARLAGYRGARVSGIPFTSERQLAGVGPAEASATIVHRALAELELEEHVLLWNVVPTHPGTIDSNRTPSRSEVEAGLGFTRELAVNRRILCVGRVAHDALGGTYLRHPSHGGARAFRCGLIQLLDRDEPATDPA